jgi:murein DD-endopeptidase MepM/ murein hydrolase activator NlpD
MSRRQLTAALIALALAVPAAAGASGSSAGDTFAIVSAGPVSLPSSAVPNGPAGLTTAPDFTTPPPATALPSSDQLQDLWQRAGGAYGIPWEVLAAINKIESNFGRNMGPSSAGAIGWMQFLPSTWMRWGTDANQDGIADPWNADDAIFSAARYLAAAGGGMDISRGLFAYNHAQWYVDEVLQLANLYGGAGVDFTASFDELQQRLAGARLQVVDLNKQLVAAKRVERKLARAEGRLTRFAGRSRLLSDRLSADKWLAQIGVRRAAATTEVERLRALLDSAEAGLEAARNGAAAASFAPAAGDLLGAPLQAGNYVFPVGGGPTVISVSHHHHDYPAADISAPNGSPLYALADGVVVGSWRTPDSRCGIGFTLWTIDGQTWTYCHLAYLEPTVVAGATLSAGAPVGLVGQTGHTTGPHLHLQLAPPISYPQEQAWFQGFAGTAFRWQDEGASGGATSSGPVFSIVPDGPEAASDAPIVFSR